MKGLSCLLIQQLQYLLFLSFLFILKNMSARGHSDYYRQKLFFPILFLFIFFFLIQYEKFRDFARYFIEDAHNFSRKALDSFGEIRLISPPRISLICKMKQIDIDIESTEADIFSSTFSSYLAQFVLYIGKVQQ